MPDLTIVYWRDIPAQVIVGKGRTGSKVNDPARAEAELGWRATRSVDDMCVDTWRWQSHNPHGYPEG